MKMDDPGLRAAAARMLPMQRVALADLPALVQAGRAAPFRGRGPGAGPAGFRPFDPAALVQLAPPDAVPVMAPEPDAAPATDAAPGPGPASAAPPPPAHAADAHAAGHAAGLAEGLAQGHARGLAEGRAEAEARLAQALTLLAAAHDRLAAPPAAATAAMEAALLDAVRRLASERAGQAIAADPAPFLARVAQMAGRLTQSAAQVELRLHPDDLAAVTPHLAGSPLEEAVLRPDPGLMRGDVDLRVPGVRLADLILPGARP